MNRDLLAVGVNNLIDRKHKLLFYVPEVPQASGGIAVIYQMAKILSENNYENVFILHKTISYSAPTWLGSGYENLKHLCMDEGQVGVLPEDFLIIPEGAGEIIIGSANLACKRIILAQSWLYILNTLLPHKTWMSYGIKDAIAVNSTLALYIQNVFGKEITVQVCRPSIPRYFAPNPQLKKLSVAISARDFMLGQNIIKNFYLKFPQYQDVVFKEMHNLSRQEFAIQLQECCLGVWVDRAAGFGTFPIECAKTNTPFIGLLPDIIPEYAVENSGIWTTDLLQIPTLIGQFLNAWINNEVPAALLSGTQQLAQLYTVEEEQQNVLTVFESYRTSRIFELEQQFIKS